MTDPTSPTPTAAHLSEQIRDMKRMRNSLDEWLAKAADNSMTHMNVAVEWLKLFHAIADKAIPALEDADKTLTDWCEQDRVLQAIAAIVGDEHVTCAADVLKQTKRFAEAAEAQATALKAELETAKADALDWLLCMDGIKHDPRCSNHFSGDPRNGPCLRCKADTAFERLKERDEAREHCGRAIATNTRLSAELASFREVLTIARVAINPPDLSGISLHEWNKRLKQATAQIDAAISAPAPDAQAAWKDTRGYTLPTYANGRTSD